MVGDGRPHRGVVAVADERSGADRGLPRGRDRHSWIARRARPHPGTARGGPSAQPSARVRTASRASGRRRGASTPLGALLVGDHGALRRGLRGGASRRQHGVRTSKHPGRRVARVRRQGGRPRWHPNETHAHRGGDRPTFVDRSRIVLAGGRRTAAPRARRRGPARMGRRPPASARITGAQEAMPAR